MKKIARILLPVDFSDRCLGMTHYAKALTEKYQAELILLHVVNPVFITPELGGAPPAAIAVPQWLISEKGKLLEQFAVQELAGVKVRRLVYEGIPEMQIVEIAKNEDVQLVLMPTHGYGAVRRFLIGSVTAKALDDLAVPVLTGNHMEQHAHDQTEEFPVIACAVSLQEKNQETLLAAASFATDFHSKLGVIHVCAEARKGVAPNAADLQPQLEEMVATELSQHGFHFDAGSLVCSVQAGEVAATVCGFADRVAAKLLVIGRGLPENGGAGRLHSDTYSIIRHAPCPVLSL